jgi:hypothetical protein
MPLLRGAVIFRGRQAYKIHICDVGENQRKYSPTGDVALMNSARRGRGNIVPDT